MRTDPWTNRPLQAPDRHHPIAATICTIALILSMLAFAPALAPFTPTVAVCMVTPLIALSTIRWTPRLAVVTIYWAGATIACSPLIWNLPGWSICGMVAVGFVLPIILFLQYAVHRQIL